MKETDRRLIDLASGQHQVFSRAQARDAGLSPSTLSRRIQGGQLVACGTSALHFAGAMLTWHGELMAGILDLGPDAIVSGRAAAALHEFDGFEAGPLEYLVPRAQRHRTTVGTVRSTPQIERLDRVEIDGIPCASGTRTVIELFGRVSIREAGNALDSACRKRLTAPVVVERRLQELGTSGRHAITVYEQLRRAGNVESWLEREFVSLLKRARLPLPATQRRYRTGPGRVARVDFDFAPVPVIIEVGGQRGYLSLEERRYQEERRNDLQLQGKVIYFFTSEQVRDAPTEVAATVAAALGIEVVTPDCRKRNPA